jgi:hypothetical protein
MKSFDPQKRATEILRDTLKVHGGKRDKAYWNRIDDLATALAFSASQETDPDNTGAKKPTKRWRADMMKTAAILQESAQRHIEILREPDPPPITEGPMNDLIKLLEDR